MKVTIRCRYTVVPGLVFTILLIVLLALDSHGKFDDPRLTLYRGHERTDYDHYCRKYRTECWRYIGCYADGMCAYAPVDDGEKCGRIRDDVCAQECRCHAGKPVMTVYTCDDGNPCTDDSCGMIGFREELDSMCTLPEEISDSHTCRNVARRDGSSCHPEDDDAVCMRGLCVQRASGMIYTTDPVPMKRIPSEDPED